MKPNPTSSSPHLCGAATLGEKNCPVCQACRAGEGPGASYPDMAQPKAGGLTVPQGQAPQSQAPQGQAPQGRIPQGQTPQGQAPQGQAPQGQIPQGQTPRGQAPQGQPPQGRIPQGQTPQGQTPQGQIPQGQTPQGQTPQGQIPQGQTPRGQASQGQPPQGRIPQGQTPRGQVPQGQAPQGQIPQGQTPRGQAPQGQPPQGQAPQGQAPQGRIPQGQTPQGQAPQGQAPQGQIPQGQTPRGQAPQGQPPQGRIPQGQTPQGQAPQGQAPQGQIPQGQTPQGQAPQGQPPQGQAPQGQAPQGQACQSQGPNSKAKAEPPRPTSQKALVTGGGGYFGFSLGSSLCQRGVSVVLLDIQRPKWELPKGVAFIQGDIRDGEALYRACEGVDCVFHVASYGMSGAEKLHKEQIESVNIGGTKIVIDVCIKRQIPRLIYTSTVNVAFGGKPIKQGNEDSVPYFPLEKHIDHYSRTKAIADQLILTSNGTPLPGGGTLRTCVLRPPGIYGPEEQRHLPRVAGNIKKRLFTFKFGDPRTRMNWVHVQNLVQAHLLAAEALTANKSYVASGQAYYINDGESVNLFEWISPLFDKMGYRRPWIRIPTSLAYLAATGMEYFHLVLKPICDFPPLLTRSEVWSIAVTHTFQIQKAHDQLGYIPEKFTFADSVDHYIQTWHKQQRHSPGLLRFLMVLICLLGALLLCLYLLEPSFLGLSHGDHM
ncbi:putative short-chain dehydrogenase/reductase family 42E member 2 [Trichosurus vulpecula]|uniref:putative short-chain dehydrogenase/reductase family 42E member 2 n=1 Tax=Trichosurus vulpecula TaxID=9337 RepID=UPI00186AC37E|nr:putative short-chain dehydrogenase/reductase family 42E member 2 [Trichosurus vulpecula]